MKNKLFLLLITAGFLFLSSCVPARKFEDVKAKSERLEEENKRCEDARSTLINNNRTLSEELTETEKELARLKKDTMDYGVKYRNIEELNTRLNELYEKVIAQNRDLLQSSSKEREKLALELNEKEKQLREKELALKSQETKLNEKEKSISSLTDNLEAREKRVKELETIIHKQDSAVAALRNKVNDALLGFNKNELTVEMKNGKVYVSLSEQLLFKSGSTDVDPKGREALVKLAQVLNNNPDIDIFIEGHTDNVPIRNSPRMKDNWDLSVLRATSIVRILSENKVDQKRLLAGGRGENFPVASNQSADGKSKNRRTEIILSPKLDELMILLQK